MSQGLASQHEAECAQLGLQHVLETLSEALARVDTLKLPAEVGARLQEVIDLIHAVEQSGGAEPDEGPPR